MFSPPSPPVGLQFWALATIIRAGPNAGLSAPATRQAANNYQVRTELSRAVFVRHYTF